VRGSGLSSKSLGGRVADFCPLKNPVLVSCYQAIDFKNDIRAEDWDLRSQSRHRPSPRRVWALFIVNITD
jgi:hypothetical protein